MLCCKLTPILHIFNTQVTALQNEILSNGTVTESASVFRNFSHNDTSSEQQGLLDGLQEDTKYKIVIIANNEGESSPSSSPVFFKTLEGEILNKFFLKLTINTNTFIFCFMKTALKFI